jgi:peptide-methionine (R)-S-oxide reductase
MLAAAIWPALTGRAGAAQPASRKTVEELQKNWKMLLAEGAKVPLPGEPLKLPKDEWRKRLDKMQYNILREEGTERAGTSPLNNEKRPGVYACAGCDLPLFTSDMKYESGTGWPSFFDHPGVFVTKTDYKPHPAAHGYHSSAAAGTTGTCSTTTAADRQAVVQQRCGAALHADVSGGGRSAPRS